MTSAKMGNVSNSQNVNAEDSNSNSDGIISSSFTTSKSETVCDVSKLGSMCDILFSGMGEEHGVQIENMPLFVKSLKEAQAGVLLKPLKPIEFEFSLAGEEPIRNAVVQKKLNVKVVFTVMDGNDGNTEVCIGLFLKLKSSKLKMHKSVQCSETKQDNNSNSNSNARNYESDDTMDSIFRTVLGLCSITYNGKIISNEDLSEIYADANGEDKLFAKLGKLDKKMTSGDKGKFCEAFGKYMKYSIFRTVLGLCSFTYKGKSISNEDLSEIYGDNDWGNILFMKLGKLGKLDKKMKMTSGNKGEFTDAFGKYMKQRKAGNNNNK